MNKKRFDHFLSFWQQVAQPRLAVRRGRGSQRVARAKARLRLVLASR